MRRSQFSGFAVGLIVVSALLAGCGGSGDGGTADSGQATPPPTDTNGAPTITGQPGGTVVAGQSYSFTPSASDPNGDRLTFTVANLPEWATFSATTGRISGTPTAAAVGSYANIRITVSDGSASASLAAFTITVSDVANSDGSATLSWAAPTQNSDGSALTNLAGYQVLYGRSAGNLSQSVSIDNVSINRYVVENLSSGTWYFAVVAVSSAGVTSALSNTASKTIS